MHQFDYRDKPTELLTPEVVSMLNTLYECKGRQDLFIEAKPDVLTQLLEVAKIQSTGASNRIEGIFTTDERLVQLVKEKATPKNRSEEEIAGYREALGIIHENYEYISPCVNMILSLHKNLYSYSGLAIGGQFKNTDNVIAETTAAGQQRVRHLLTEIIRHGHHKLRVVGKRDLARAGNCRAVLRKRQLARNARRSGKRESAIE